MAKKSKSKVAGDIFPRKDIPYSVGENDEESGRNLADLITSPEFSAYRVVGMMQAKTIADEIDAPTMLDTLRDQAAAVQKGGMAYTESMLINQATSLQAVFVRLLERAMSTEYLQQLDGFMKLALKAQNQCRMTLETLSTIKNPPVVYAKQANIANNQQVNNNKAVPVEGRNVANLSRAREIENQQNQLMEADYGKRVDTETTGEASRNDSAMATVDTINGTENGRG